MQKFHKRDLLSYMPRVKMYDESISGLNDQWENLKLLSEINCPHESQNLLPNMSRIQNRFVSLKQDLIDTLIVENLKKTERKMISKAQVTVDILIRNLYERTADVGFLATDIEICNFLLDQNRNKQQKQIIQNRLAEYVAKYSVYEEIIILDKEGLVLANLDQSNDILGRQIDDEIVDRTINSSKDFEESFQSSSLLPCREKAHIFSRKILQPDTNETVGMICLCFRFYDEMELIFNKLAKDYDGSAIMIVDEKGCVIASSDNNHVPTGITMEIVKPYTQNLIYYRGQAYLSCTVPTKGYESYYGLGWQGQVIIPLQLAFPEKKRLDGVEDDAVTGLMEMADSFSVELKKIIEKTGKINNLLNRIVYNGQIMARSSEVSENSANNLINAEKDDMDNSVNADEEYRKLRPILNSIGQIGSKTSKLFQSSVSNLFATVVSKTLEDADYLASLSIDIMDRNLYERANDCRWWALNSTFRNLLRKDSLTHSDKHKIEMVLSYIHSLYTVYSKLFIFNKQGEIVASSYLDKKAGLKTESEETISSESSQEFYQSSLVQQILSNTKAERYFVSRFEKSSHYNGDFTYIYGASITDPENSESTIGGIAIVFDSTDQFQTMLTDALDNNENSFAVYTDNKGFIISSTTADLSRGSQLEVTNDFFKLTNGKAKADIINFDGCYYAVGCACSSGYREYKSTDNYSNDVFSFVFERLSDCSSAAEIDQSAVQEVEQREIVLPPKSKTRKIATFSVDSQLFAFDHDVVLEVIDASAIVTIPDINGQLAGAVKYKENYIAVINTRALFNKTDSHADSLNLLVIRHEQDSAVALIVDGLHKVLEIADSMVKPVPMASSISGIISIKSSEDDQSSAKTILMLDHLTMMNKLAENELSRDWQTALASLQN